jgi:hypothetical protein
MKMANALMERLETSSILSESDIESAKTSYSRALNSCEKTAENAEWMAVTRLYFNSI